MPSAALALAAVLLAPGLARPPDPGPDPMSWYLRQQGPRPAPAAPASRPVLQASDFTFLGHYVVSGGLGGVAYGWPITHRYVGGQLRFLVTEYNGSPNFTYDLIEFALPAGAFGQTISAKTNTWPDAQVWAFRSVPGGSALQGCHWSIHYEDLGGGTGRLWECFGVDYPGTGPPYTFGMTLALANCTLNANGTVSNYLGTWGFQGVSQRCVMGKVQPVPAWAQAQYGFGPYLYGFGGYASLMAQGGSTGVVSLGLFALAGPDVSSYTPAASWPAPAYAGGGTDWTVPSTDFTIVADHRSGASQGDWYTTPGAPTSWDRGERLNNVANYYDGGQNDTSPAAGNATFTAASATVTFSQAQSLNAGDWIGPTGGNALKGVAGQVVASSTSNSTTATLTAAFNLPGAGTGGWDRFVAPPAAPAGGGWLSPAPDGKARLTWTDSYFGSGLWIDGPNKTGIVCVGSFGLGKAWYGKPGNQPTSDSAAAEIHVFDPADLYAVKLGLKHAWNVQPAAMKDITGDLTPLGICTLGHNAEPNGPAGATYDPTTKRLWIYCPGRDGVVGSVSDSILACYSVNC